MARGWESKSVEEQQQEASRGRAQHGRALTADELERAQRRATLQLARTRTETDLAHAAGGYAEMLRKQLAAIDEQLQALGAPEV